MSNMNTMVQGACFESLLRTHGRSVLYFSSVNSSSETTDAIWNPSDVSPGYYHDGEQEVHTGVIRVLPAVITDPDKSDYFTIDSETWAVTKINRTVPVVEMELERRESVRVGGANTRIQR